MTGYELYTFSLCLIVFSLLTGLFAGLLVCLVKQSLRLIAHGAEDERIKKEYEKELAAKPIIKILNWAVSSLVLALILIAFVLSLAVRLSDDRVQGNMMSPKIVLSDSMLRGHEANTYLVDNALDDQFDMHDLIFIRALPKEFDLKLYDIVMYERADGDLIIHRIVGIEEPNEKHPEHRQFLLRGDASKYADEYPVMYEQMRGIYRGERIRFVGSFFTFMQSPAGYLCLILAVIAAVATPIAEKKLWQAKLARLRAIGAIPPTGMA